MIEQSSRQLQAPFEAAHVHEPSPYGLGCVARSAPRPRCLIKKKETDVTSYLSAGILRMLSPRDIRSITPSAILEYE